MNRDGGDGKESIIQRLEGKRRQGEGSVVVCREPRKGKYVCGSSVGRQGKRERQGWLPEVLIQGLGCQKMESLMVLSWG